MTGITAHMIVKDDECFVAFAVTSVIDYVKYMLIFETASTDGTADVVRALVTRFPEKIVFEQKGACDPSRHTRLRQEMIDRTTTDWFMVVDGDEVWTRRGMTEAIDATNGRNVSAIVAPYYNCVGDIYHDYVRRGSFPILGRPERLTPRLIRMSPGLHWSGDYGHDMLLDSSGRPASTVDNSVVLRNRFWHLTHLIRSSADEETYSSGGTRASKRRPTYVGIGRRIREPVPEVFDEAFQRENRMGMWTATINGFRFVINRFR